MAADPKDTTVTEENKDTAAEAVAEAGTAADAAPAGAKTSAGTPSRKLSAEELIRAFEEEQQKTELPDIYVGDTVRVGVRIS